MSPSIHNISSREVIQILLKKWFTVSHQKGSHVQFKKWSLRVTVPDHGKKVLNIRTTMSIIRQSGLSKEDFV